MKYLLLAILVLPILIGCGSSEAETPAPPVQPQNTSLEESSNSNPPGNSATMQQAGEVQKL